MDKPSLSRVSGYNSRKWATGACCLEILFDGRVNPPALTVHLPDPNRHYTGRRRKPKAQLRLRLTPLGRSAPSSCLKKHVMSV